MSTATLEAFGFEDPAPLPDWLLERISPAWLTAEELARLQGQIDQRAEEGDTA